MVHDSEASHAARASSQLTITLISRSERSFLDSPLLLPLRFFFLRIAASTSLSRYTSSSHDHRSAEGNGIRFSHPLRLSGVLMAERRNTCPPLRKRSSSSPVHGMSSRFRHLLDLRSGLGWDQLQGSPLIANSMAGRGLEVLRSI